MSWLFEHRRVASAQNGTITASRAMGSWRVSVKGCGQTSTHTNEMWADALRRVNPLARSVLMLGLGAAGSVPRIHARLPQCAVTAVEYDPNMTALARELKLYEPAPFPKVIEGDAKDALAALDERYDLIIVDLFDGPEPSALCTEEEFVELLKARLSSRGAALFNVYKRAEYLTEARRSFPRAQLWRFGDNHLGLFSL